MANLTGELTGNWTLHRIIANDGGAGSFTDDDDLVGTNVAPAEVQGVHAQNNVSGTASGRLSIFVVGLDSNGAPVARGSSSMTITLVEQCITRGDEIEFEGRKEYVMDSTALSSTPLQRRVDVALEKGSFFVRLSDFASMPASAVELRVYVKGS